MLGEIEDAIIARCEALVGQHVRAVQPLPADWQDSLLRAARRLTPGVFVAWPGGQRERSGQQLEIAGRWRILVLTDHASGARERRRGTARQVGAYELIEHLASGLHNHTIEGVGRIQVQAIDNLYSDARDQVGVAIYGLDLRLPMTFGAPGKLSDLAPFETYHATHEIAGGNPAEDIVNLPQE